MQKETLKSTSRIKYIDAIKGFAVLWVVVYHFKTTLFPEWVSAEYRMPFFFFLSGLFFRPKPYNEYLHRRYETIVKPFFFFLLISYMFVIFRYEVIGRLLGLPQQGNESWEIIHHLQELFNLHNADQHTPLQPNSALWFLISLFTVQILYRILYSLSKKPIALLPLTLMLHLIGIMMEKTGINGLFYLYCSMFFILYYSLGHIASSWILRIAEQTKKSTLISLTALFCFIALQFTPNLNNWLSPFLAIIKTLTFTLFLFLLFSQTHKWKIMRPLAYFGRNSIIIFGTHTLVIQLFSIIMMRGLHLYTHETASTSVLYQILLFIFVCISEYILIFLGNRFFPSWIGRAQKKSIEIKS